MSETSVELLCATADLLSAWLDSPEQLGKQLELRIPPGWPEFPEAIPYTYALQVETGADPNWWMYFFLDRSAGALVGSGGFKGAPVAGMVEIGYEIAPEFRGNGYATAAVEALLRLARESGQVDQVTAQTLQGPNGSTALLTKLGFSQTGTTSADEGEIWHWQLPLS